MLQQLEALEGRRLMADISVVLASNTLAANLTAGAAIKPAAKASFTVSKDSAVLSKTQAKAKLTLTVTLHPASGADIVLGTAKVSASALAKKPATAKVTFSKLKVAPAAGAYTLGATLSGQTAVGDTNAANDSTSTPITVSAPTGGTGSATPFSGSLVNGSKITFKKNKLPSIPGGLGFESGTWTSNAGEKGTYYLTFGTGSSDGICGMAPTEGQSFAPFAIQFAPGTKPGGKSFTFGVAQAGSKGSVQYAGNTIYYK